jgi:hypothetical protein
LDVLIEHKKLSDLKPYPKNARTHSKEQVKQIVNSIEEFGFTNPVLTDGKNGIIAGHGRVMAAKEMGMTKVPTVPLAHLSKDQIRAYVVADNKLTLNGGWDEEILNEELLAIDDSDIDLELTGFSLDDVKRELEPSEEDDEVPEVDENVHNVQRGDIWQLGDHRLMCGDSTSKEDVDKLMDGVKADMVFTDPPYGINANKQTLGSGKKAFRRGGDWDKQRPDISKWVSYDKVIIWGGNYFADILPPTNDWLCWHKKNDGRSFSEFELAWTNLGKNCRHISHNWSGEEKSHPTQKPLTVVLWAMGIAPSRTVIDPFLGSGSTLIACEKTKRKCYGMEIDPHYCSVIIERWQQYTEQVAVKHG